MKLGKFLQNKGITQEAFGEMIGVTAASVSRYVSGDRIPVPSVMRRILKVTKGWVTAEDLLDMEPAE